VSWKTTVSQIYSIQCIANFIRIDGDLWKTKTFWCVFSFHSVEMLSRRRTAGRDGHRHQADDDFGGWVKSTVLFLAVSGPKFMKLWDDVCRGPFVVYNAVFGLFISCSLPEILAFKSATELRTHRK